LFLSEKRSLYRFLLIYIGSSLLLFLVSLTIFYQYEKHRLIDIQNTLLKEQSSTLPSELKALQESQDSQLFYPLHVEFRSALYDIDLNYLFGEFQPKQMFFEKEFWQTEQTLFYLQKISPYYLGTAYIIIKKPIDFAPIESLIKQLIAFFLLIMLFITGIAFWLGRLFLSPMRHSIILLDDFIKDATHELNTPVSTILANAELLKDIHPELENTHELLRIESASKRLSRIYDDLAYLHLKHKRHRSMERINLSSFLKERLTDFQSIAHSKQITCTDAIEENIFFTIDKEDITRIIDNLLANAFKYTHAKGSVHVSLDSKHLSIEDSGVGISQQMQKEVLERFVRDNKSEGGFGLGLSIVADLVRHYNFDLELQSEINQGTKVSILWKK
jgi:two-component system OmpR family sensor kinase